MDYEKKYKEALKDMRVIYPNLKGDAKLAAEHAFPELAESEDERIRKVLLNLVSNDKANGYTQFYEKGGITCDDAIAYLEKQKEQREVTPETCLKGIFDFDDISQLELAVDCYKEKKGRAYPVTVKHQHEVLMKLYDLIGIDREALEQDEEDETD